VLQSIVMEGITWAALGILAAGQLGTLFYLGSRIDALASRMDARFDHVDARFDSVEQRLDGVNARIDAHLERHSG
jgi:hypothetical protein